MSARIRSRSGGHIRLDFQCDPASGSPPDRRRRALLVGAVATVALAALPGVAIGASDGFRIGIIGTGRIGGALAELWAKAGHELLISSRHPDDLKPLAARLGANVRVGTPREAAAFGDVVLIAVPYGALPQVGRDYAGLMARKVVLETGNPRRERDGPMATPALERGTGVASAEYLPGVRLVRVFTSVPYLALRSEAHRNGERIGVPLAADDQDALAVAARLVEDAGFEPVPVGGLARARDFDVGSPVFGRALTARELRQALGLLR
ncbi:NAD(P)-binding domain-containing protein [Aromatoleum toluclasticum]|uniref:NADPH-dependent F420 reductase n=1 Tax=Aromatoleum toluclasticum TaxID=92003 RepID=UPI001D18D50A|nr:NAD(P)-binding domain-containing protein [Aromatoleum toluclasticum]MCC4115833.1 NAD(P)-binding domain-containing protein [Aromatoleum toluclasticum]